MTETAFNPEQNAFLVALRELYEAQEKLSLLAGKLPTIPTTVEGDDFEIIEPGYTRTENMTIEIFEGGQYFNGITNGWDSMGEHGAASYVDIDGLPYALPADIEWS